MEINIDGYKIKRKDRGALGGSVAFYVKNASRYTRRKDLEEPDMEAVCVELKFRKATYLIVCVCRAPNVPNYWI